MIKDAIDQSETPLVSVIIPTYNRAHVIERSINSVLNQTYKNLELIIIDDGSTDNTEDVLKNINDSRINYFYQENAGAPVARNNGIDKANGKIIAFHDSDDVWRLNKLEKQVRVLLEEDCDVVVCKSLRDDGTKKTAIPKRIKDGYISEKDDLFGIGTHTICGHTHVFKKNRFDTSFQRYQELEWLYRLLQSEKIYCIDEGLVEYSINEDSISSDEKKILSAFELLLKKYPNIKKRSPQICMHVVRDLVLECILSKRLQKEDKKKSIAMAFKYYPGLIRYCRRSRYSKK